MSLFSRNSSSPRAALIHAAKTGDLKTMKKLLQNGTRIEARDAALLEALRSPPKGHILEIVSALLETETGMAARNEALILAASKGYPLTTQRLLKAGTGIEARDTALVEALRQCPEDNILEVASALLLKAETGMAARDKALTLAASKGYPRTTLFLLAAGTSAEARDATLIAALRNCPENQALAISSTLLLAGIGSKALGEALETAIEKEYSDTTQLIRLVRNRAQAEVPPAAPEPPPTPPELPEKRLPPGIASGP